MTGSAQTRRRESGSVLVTALWLLGALAVLIGTMAAYTRATSGVISVELDRLKAQGLMDAALEIAAFRFGGAGDATPVQDRFTTETGRDRTTVSYIGESARVDINLAPPELLQAMFQSLGVKADRARQYADWIVTFRSPPQQQTSADRKPSGGPSPVPPRHTPFVDILELDLVGLPADLVAKALPLLTASSGQALPDARLASPALLKALPEMTAERVRTVLELRARDKPDMKAIGAALGKAKDLTADTTARSIRVTMDVQLSDGFAASAEAVIVRYAEDIVPYRVLSWNDRIEAGHARRAETTDVE